MCSPLHICCILNFFSTVQPRPTLPERHVQSGSGFYIADKTYSQKRRGLMNCRCCNNWVILQDSTLSKPQYWYTPLNTNTVDIECFTWNIPRWSTYVINSSESLTRYSGLWPTTDSPVKSASRIKIWSSENEDSLHRVATTTSFASCCSSYLTKISHQNPQGGI